MEYTQELGEHHEQRASDEDHDGKKRRRKGGVLCKLNSHEDVNCHVSHGKLLLIPSSEVISRLSTNRSSKRTVGHAPQGQGDTRTSSNGLVSLKQLSQTSLTARSADAVSGHAGFARTERTARRRTHACGHGHGHGNRVYIS